MSSKDDPFGSGGKTVIRPNPGGAFKPDSVRPAPVPGGPGRKPPANSTVISPMPGGGGAPPHSPQPAPPPTPQQKPRNPVQYSPGQHGMPNQPDDWMHGNSGQQAFFPGMNKEKAPIAEPVDKIPLDVALNAPNEVEFSAANPITAAAAPLLILLGRLRLLIIDMEAVPLMTHVAESIKEFERKVLAAGVSKEDAMVAKYALCGTADDIVQNLPGTDRHVWMQYSMLAQFFQVRTSGVGFFEELNKILQTPAPHYDLLELMHACLSLGFEGQYRGTAGGDADLQRIRRDVYQTLRHLRARNDDDISPRWRGMAKMLRNTGRQIPLWAIASVVGVMLVAVYLLLRFLLTNEGDGMADRLIALNPNEPISIERAALVPDVDPIQPDTTQLDRIRAALTSDIAGGSVNVEQVGEQIVVEVNNLILFDSGSADVKPQFEEVAIRIAGALDPEPGPINIIGHTDSVKPSPTSRFKSNFDLSVARAKSVESIIHDKITDTTRIKVDGRGADDPIADNGTREGRAKNRRVEIMIPREETL